MSSGMLGREGWLFYRPELTRDSVSAIRGIDLIARATRLLEAEGTSVVVVLVPLKARVYAPFLPESLPRALSGDYSRHLERLRSAGVRTFDINTAFLASAARSPDSLLFPRQDTHWSAFGALLAAETIRDGLLADSATRAILGETRSSPRRLLWSRETFFRHGDLVGQTPDAAAVLPSEPLRAFSIERDVQADLFSEDAGSSLVLLGSSYSAAWTGFPRALEFALQRDLPSVSITADRGQWAGLDLFLRNPAFQRKRPRLLIWEIPERDLDALPGMPYRQTRYIFDEDEWISRIGALVSRRCEPGTTSAVMRFRGLEHQDVKGVSTTSSDTIEITLEAPAATTDFFSVQLQTNGSRQVRVELASSGAATRRLIFDMPGDGELQSLSFPLSYRGRGFTRVRILPGTTRTFVMTEPRVCLLPYR